MEDVLDVSAEVPGEDEPLICMDEAGKQLLDDELSPIPMIPGHPLREDYHDERNGTQALFMFFNPHSGWRRVSCRDSRTRIDWAEEIRQLLLMDYPQAKKVKLVCGNLNTHSIASLYEAFTASEAHILKQQRLELHFTPRNGNWLNVAKIELGVLSRQCLTRRIPTAAELPLESAAWQAERNTTASKVRWQFTTADARRKLHRFYPQL